MFYECTVMFPEGRNITTKVTEGKYSLRYNAEICSAFGHARFAVRAVNCAGMGPSAIHISNSPPNTVGTLLEPPLAWVGEEGEVGRGAGIIWLGMGETYSHRCPAAFIQIPCKQMAYLCGLKGEGLLIPSLDLRKMICRYLHMVGACHAPSPTPPLPHVHLTANIHAYTILLHATNLLSSVCLQMIKQ